ncbi:DUF551 domain-containing protein [Escherichia coli]|nr:DUF551 domain-containing protein [Escherichia coli]
MTTNHPAHGPVSLDRLHQISEILSKAAAQSDGGNLGYAMSDAVKVIDEVLAGRKAEPVGTFRKRPCGYYPSFHEDAVPLYTTPPAPVIPEGLRLALSNAGIAAPESDEMLTATHEKYTQMLVTWVMDRKPFQPAPVMPDECKEAPAYVKALTKDGAYIYGFNACRAATLQAGNSPVSPDGWIPVSERLPERDVDVKVYCADKKEQMVGYMERNETEGWFRFASLPNGGGVYCKPTHWMPLPAAPQQEVK